MILEPLLIEKENSLSFISSFSTLLKSIDDAKTLGGVPVFSLCNLKPSSSKDCDNSFDVFWPSGPSFFLVLPLNVNDFKYVPVVIITLLPFISSKSVSIVI